MASSAVEESTTTARKRPRSSTVAEIEAPPANVYLELEATKGAAAAAAATLKAFADRVHDLDPGFVAQLPTEHLPAYAQHLAKPGYLEATGEIKNKVTFGAEQQHLLGAGFVRQRRVGRTACVPPKPEAVAFLGQLLKTLFSKKLITHAEVGALNVLLGWHSSTTIFEDWAPWASSGMKASAEELAEAEAELLRAHAAGEPAAHKLRWLETFFVTLDARRLSCTGASAATTMYEATEKRDLQHVCVDGLLAYYVRPGSTDGEHVTAPDVHVSPVKAGLKEGDLSDFSPYLTTRRYFSCGFALVERRL